MKAFRLTTALLVLSSAALLSSIAPASAGVARDAPVTRGSTYLALGDSLTFGFQEPQVQPAPNYLKASSFVAYPQLAAQVLHVHVVNAACPGETAASLINPSAQSNGCENALGHGTYYRAHFPLHVSYHGSQLTFAVSYLRAHPGVRLVSLMIGANDLFLCQKATKDGCLGAAEQRALFARISANVTKILSAIRNGAHYTGQIVIVNYYSLNYASSLINSVVHGLNAAQDQAARPFGAEIADGYGELQAASRTFGGDPCAAGLLTRLGAPGKCGVHATLAAHALLSLAVLDAIR